MHLHAHMHARTHTVLADMYVLYMRQTRSPAPMAHVGLHKVVVDSEECLHCDPHSPEGLLHTLHSPAKPTALHLKELHQEA